MSNRIAQITAANETLLSYLSIWEAQRHTPGVSNFAFGNPQEMAVEGFASALAASAVPGDKDHYEY